MRTLYLKLNPHTQNLPEACLALTPKIAVYPGALFLDIGVTERAFKGEVRQLEKLKLILKAFDCIPEGVLGDRPEWLPTFFQPDTWTCLPKEASHKALLSLPIERLLLIGDPKEALDEKTERMRLIIFFKRVGIYRVQDFMRLSPLAINRRFGKLGDRLRTWVEGGRAFPIPTFEATDPIEEEIELEEHSLDAILFSSRKAFLRIESRLEGRALLAKQLRLTFTTEEGQVVRSLNLNEPLRDTPSFLRLLRDFLDGLHFETDLTRLKIEIADTITATPGQLSLFDNTENRKVDLGHFINRLHARYGENTAGFAELKESHLPEKSFTLSYPFKAPPFSPRPFPKRPLFLLDPPKPYAPSPHGELFLTERLSTEWWAGETPRTYFIYLTPQGERLWLYKDQNKKWFLHGTFQ